MADLKKKKGQVTQELIVQKAIHLFAKTGFSGTGFKELADACKMSEAAIFYHFPSKEALISATLNAIVIHNHAIVSAMFDISDNAGTGLLKHLNGNIKWAIENPEEGQILILVYYFGCFNLEFSEIYTGLQSRARLRILSYLLAGEREKIFRLTLPAEEVAQSLHDLLVGNFVNLLSTRLQLGKKQVLKSTLKEQEKKWSNAIERFTGFRPSLRVR